MMKMNLPINQILNGDCIEHLKELPDNSIDAIITDPPYGLEFMGKEWDKFEPNRLKQRWAGTERKFFGDWEEKKFYQLPQLNQTKNPKCKICGHYKFSGTPCKCETPQWEVNNQYRLSLQDWVTQWATECLRVLKPGGYLLAFGGTRTYHRMACGIEDAGFEIRDCIMWLYGSGFPKSLNISKQIDKSYGRRNVNTLKLKERLNELREKKGYSKQEMNKLCGFEASNFFRTDNHLIDIFPKGEKWIKIKEVLGGSKEIEEDLQRLYEEAKREVIGKKKTNLTVMQRIGDKNLSGEIDITKPATPEAKQWEGWGTALKPAVEPIVVARKPLSEKNVALNVLKWGTGGINIDACRIGNELIRSSGDKKSLQKWKEQDGRKKKNLDLIENTPNWNQGRFPANIILECTCDEVIEKPEQVKEPEEVKGGIWRKSGGKPAGRTYKGGVKIHTNPNCPCYMLDKQNKGASRFFYCAKASKSERNFGLDDLPDKAYGQSGGAQQKLKEGETEYLQDGHIGLNKIKIVKNNHPTVKPIKLMEYLIKLVTREGAIVIDPFFGSGTTAIACIKLNRKFIGIEKEPEYIEIAKARIKPFLEQKKLEV